MSSNNKLAWMLGGAIILISIIFTGLTIFSDVVVFSFLQQVPGKYIGVYIGNAFLLAVGTFIFWIFHRPSPHRIIVTTWSASLGICVVTGGAPLGLTLLQTAAPGREGIYLNFDFAKESSSGTIAVCLFTAAIMAFLYIKLLKYEQINGPLQF